MAEVCCLLSALQVCYVINIGSYFEFIWLLQHALVKMISTTVTVVFVAIIDGVKVFELYCKIRYL